MVVIRPISELKRCHPGLVSEVYILVERHRDGSEVPERTLG
jgi:hypothetical protein